MSSSTNVPELNISEGRAQDIDEKQLYADRIKRCADIVGTIDRLAELSGIPRRTLGGYLAKRTMPKVASLVAISRAAGVSLEWLVTGDGPVSREEPPALDARLDDDAVIAAAVILTLNDIKRLGRNPTGPLIATLFREHLDNSAKEGARYDADELIARISSDVNL